MCSYAWKDIQETLKILDRKGLRCVFRRTRQGARIGALLQPLRPEAQSHFARNAWKALESIWILPTATKRVVSIHDLYEAIELAATHLSASSCPPFDFPKASFVGSHQRRGAWPKHPSGKV